jgi:GABA permease
MVDSPELRDAGANSREEKMERIEHARRPSTTVVATFGSVAAALVACALVVALAVRPPALGWVGFAIVAISVLALTALVPLAFERTRVSALEPADPVDLEQRLLVIADPHCSEPALCDEIASRLAGAVAVHLVVPVRVSHLHFMADDESEEQREAERSLRRSLGLLQQRGVPATGSVGSDKPLESMTDALATFAATHVLLATPPEAESYWLERDLLAKARPLTGVPVSQVVVPPTPDRTEHR